MKKKVSSKMAVKDVFRPNPTTQYKIVSSKDENMCLSLNKSVHRYQKMILCLFNNSNQQKFVFKQSNVNISMKIENNFKESALCLKPQKYGNGQFIKFSTVQDLDSEQWYIEPCRSFSKNSVVTCRIRHSSGLYVDLNNQKIFDSNDAVLWNQSNSSSQVWKIIPI